MKHGIYYVYWQGEYQADYPYYIEKVARLGFDVLEIGTGALFDYSEEALAGLRRCAEDNGILLTGGYGPTPETSLCSTDPAVRKTALARFQKLFGILEKVGIRTVVGSLYGYWPVDFACPLDRVEDRERGMEGIGLLVEDARNSGVTMALEVINRYSNYILNTAEEGVAFLRDLGAPEEVKLHLDTFHMNIEEISMGDAIRTAGKMLGYLHTSDNNRDVPGRGALPWPEIGEALRDIGYEGCVVMEPFVRPIGQVGRNVHCWRDLLGDGGEAALDARAQEALVFSRKTLG